MQLIPKIGLPVLMWLLLAGSSAIGQTSGSIDGEARDAMGAPVPGIVISATNQGTNATRVATTKPGGTKESFKFRDPDGFLVQVNGPDYVGHVGT